MKAPGSNPKPLSKMTLMIMVGSGLVSGNPKAMPKHWHWLLLALAAAVAALIVLAEVYYR